MKNILAICLIATAFVAIAPQATASNYVCQAGACAYEGSYTYGTCQNGYNYNYVGAGAYEAGTFVGAGASTYCGGYPGYYSASGIGAYGYSYGTGGYNYAGASWYSFAYGSYNYCSTSAYSSVGGYMPLGCPAGGPPGVPSLLP